MEDNPNKIWFAVISINSFLISYSPMIAIFDERCEAWVNNNLGLTITKIGSVKNNDNFIFSSKNFEEVEAFINYYVNDNKIFAALAQSVEPRKISFHYI